MQPEIHVGEALRHTFSAQPIPPLGCWHQLQCQPFNGASNASPMAASALPVSGITRLQPDYSLSGVCIPKPIEQNVNQGSLYSFNEGNISYGNNNLLLKDLLQPHQEQVFPEITSLQNQNNSEEIVSVWPWTQDLHALSSSTNLLSMTYTSNMHSQYLDSKEQGKMNLSNSINSLARTWSEGAKVSAPRTRSTIENPHLGQTSNSIYSSTNLLVRFSPPTMNEEQLVKIFKPYGRIVAHIITRNIHTGENLGLGFVRYETHEQAMHAMATLNNLRKPIINYDISVRWAKRKHDNVPTYKERWCMRKLFVRNIPQDVTHAMLENLFRSYGEVQGVSMHRDTSAAGQSTSNPSERRIAFVIYASAGVAQEACKAIHNTYPFPSCGRVPLMIKIVEDYPTRPHKHSDGPSSPSHQCGQKKTNMVPAALTGRGVATHEANGSPPAFAIPSSGNLYCPSNNNLSVHTPSIPNIVPSGSMSSSPMNQVLPFETSDAARGSYTNNMEGPLTYSQIPPLPQQLPMGSVPFTFNDIENQYLQVMGSNSGGNSNPNAGAASLPSPKLVQPAPVAPCDLQCYGPQSLKCTGTVNWLPSMARTSSSLTQAASHTGNSFRCYGGANNTTETTSPETAFPTLSDVLQVGSHRVSQTFPNEDSRSDIKSSPLTLSICQTKNMNETCSRFGRVIEVIHNLSIANQEYSVSTTANDTDKPIGTTTEKAFSSSYSRGVGNADVVSFTRDKGLPSGTLSSSTSSGMVCFPSYSATDSSMASGISHANRCSLNASQKIGAVCGTADLPKWATNPSEPWVASLQDDMRGPLPLIIENPHAPSEEDSLDEDAEVISKYLKLLNPIQ